MIRHFILGISLTICSINLPVQASANLDYEDWLYSIYVDFYKKSTSPEEWQSALASNNFQTYRVKNGDNLSQISQSLLGSSSYWPKLWAVNSQLSNPHLISENTQLSIGASGDLAFIPSSSQLRKKITVTFKEQGEDGKIIKKNKTILLPQFKRRLQPVLKSFPASFPNWSGVYYQSQSDSFADLAVNIVKPPLSQQVIQVFLKSMIVGDQPRGIGEVLSSGRKLLFSKGEDMFIKVFGDFSIEPGQLLRVIDRRPVYYQKGLVGAGLVRVKAELKVLEVIDNTEEAFYKEYKVKLSESFFGVSAGDSIIDGGIKRFVVQKNSPQSKVFSRLSLIVGGRGDSSPALLNLYSLVYLNIGSNESLNIGDTLPIYQNLHSRGGGGGRKWGGEISAYINIIDVKSSVATAVVSKVMSDVQVGDRVGNFDRANQSTFEVGDSGQGESISLEGQFEVDDFTEEDSGEEGESDLEEELDL